MDTLANFRTVLKEFGSSIKLSNLSLDDKFYCALTVDNSLEVQIRYSQDKEQFSFISEVGVLEGSNYERCCDCLLKANGEWTLTQGMTLAKVPEERSITLGYHQSANQLDPSQFRFIFKHFIDLSETWKNYLTQMSQGELPEVLAEL